MTVVEAINLFELEMKNEILNSHLDETSKDLMLKAVTNVAAVVISTHESSGK